jgi:hypothetical protein
MDDDPDGSALPALADVDISPAADKPDPVDAADREKTKFHIIKREAIRHQSLAWVASDDLATFIAMMEQEQAQFGEHQKYLDARQSQIAAEAAILEQKRRQKMQLATPPALLEPDFAGANQRLHDVDVLIEEFDRETQQKIDSLRRYQEKKLNNFEIEWRQVMPEKYRRPSKRLSHLRESTLSLAAMKRFDEANAQKILADQLEMKEFQDAQRLLITDYNIAKRTMLEKFASDMNHLVGTRYERKQILLARRRVAEESMINRSLVLLKKPTLAGIASNGRSADTALSQLAKPMKQHMATTTSKLPPLRPPNVQRDHAKRPS